MRSMRLSGPAALSLSVIVLGLLAAGCSGDGPSAGARNSPTTVPTLNVAGGPRFARAPAGWQQAGDGHRSVAALSWDYQPDPRGWGRPEVFRGDRIAISAIMLCPDVNTSSATPKLPSGPQSIDLRVDDPGDVGALEGVPGSVEHRFEPLVGGLRVDLRVDFAQPPDAAALRAAQSVLEGGLILPAELGCPGPAGASAPGRMPASPAWRVHREAATGITVALPRPWRVAPRPLTPRLVDPLEVLSLGTGPFPAQPRPCNHMPGAAISAMGRRGTLLSVQERAAPEALSPAPICRPAAGSPWP